MENSNICQGNNKPYSIRRNVLLVGRIHTDFIELRFKDEIGNLIDEPSTLYSTGHLLVKSLCSYLAIEEQEVAFGLKKYNGFNSIFLFDTAKGGAGYVSQFSAFFKEICSRALHIAERCDCTSACTKCLIDKISQHFIEQLDRKPVICLLERVLDQEVPTEIELEIGAGVTKVIGDVKTDISRLIFKKLIKTVYLFADINFINISDFDNFPLVHHLKLYGVDIKVVFRGEPLNLFVDDKLTLLQLKSSLGIKDDLYYTDDYQFGDMNLVARVVLNDGVLDYFSKNYSSKLDNEWGNTYNEFTYRKSSTNGLNLSAVDLRFDFTNDRIAEVHLSKPTKVVNARIIFDLFHNQLTEGIKNRLNKIVYGKTVQVEYSDRYLKSPLACLLMIHFIQRLKNAYKLSIDKLTIISKSSYNDRGYDAEYIKQDFSDDAERLKFIKMMYNGGESVNIKLLTPVSILHYRSLTIKSNETIIATIRPDAGIAHGWFAKNPYLRTQDISLDTDIYVEQKLNDSLLYTIIIPDNAIEISQD